MLALVFVIVPRPAMPRSFDYLAIEAATGASSGGHAAIRFGDDTYHFVNADPGIVRAVRVRSDEFDYVYRAYDNRGIDVTRVEVPDPAYETLRMAFVRRVLVEDAQIDVLDSARQDERLLDWLSRRASGAAPSALPTDPGVVLRGAGYFYPGIGDGALHADPASGDWSSVLIRTGAGMMRAMREAIAQEHGPGWLTREIARLDAEISELRYADVAAPGFARDRIPDTGAEFAKRYTDLMLARLALHAIATGQAPLPEGFRTSAGPNFRLDAPAIQAMKTWAGQERSRVRKLVSSSRRDVGFALLVAMARSVAMETSVALGRLVVPDTFEDNLDVITPAQLLDNADAAAVVLSEKQEELAAARRAALSDAARNEFTWSRLEVAANLYLEFERGFVDQASIRIEPASVPSRVAALDPAWPQLDASPALLQRWREHARVVRTDVQARLGQLYGYDLVSRNCVTEIFATVDSAFAATPPPSTPDVAEREALGGRVDGERDWNFIPFVSAAAVNDAYRVTGRLRLPSYRHYWLDRMLRDTGSITTRLRESNTLTSRLYQHGEADIFLFFTDDKPVLRPVLGATNVLFGTGAAAAGLLALPFDHGRLAAAGLRGVLFSIPELAFINIRKGSNALVPRDWMETPGFNGQTGTDSGDSGRLPEPG